MKEHNTFVYFHESVEMASSESETERLRDGCKTASVDTALWTNIQNLTSVSQLGATNLHLISTRWLLSESGQITVSTENILSLYNILNALTFSFKFLSHMIYFCCSLVYTGAISCFEIPNKSVSQRSASSVPTKLMNVFFCLVDTGVSKWRSL